MRRKKHKRKTRQVIIVASDAVDAKVKQYRVRPWLTQTLLILLCAAMGALIGFIYYEERIWEAANKRNTEQVEAIKVLEEEKRLLTSQVESLNSKIQILSETVNQKIQNENELTAQLESQSMPTEFPLTGSASMEEGTEGDPICIFTASEGTTVVATASGTVTSVSDGDEEYGNVVTIDHGNGYITVYRNKGESTVKQGDKVVQGTTLFIIEEDNNKLGYQMMKDSIYINPMDMLAISG